MVTLTGPLAKLVKKTRLVLLSVDDDSSKNTDVIRVELKEKLRVKGSNPLPNGKDMIHSEDFLFVAAEDVPLFMANVKEEDDGTIVYEGPLKLDVSKPKGGIVNGQWVWRTQPKLWLVSTLFSRRGGELIQNSQDTMRDALNALFAPPEETPEEIAKREAAAKATSTAGAQTTGRAGATVDVTEGEKED